MTFQAVGLQVYTSTTDKPLADWSNHFYKMLGLKSAASCPNNLDQKKLKINSKCLRLIDGLNKGFIKETKVFGFKITVGT